MSRENEPRILLRRYDAPVRTVQPLCTHNPILRDERELCYRSAGFRRMPLAENLQSDHVSVRYVFHSRRKLDFLALLAARLCPLHAAELSFFLLRFLSLSLPFLGVQRVHYRRHRDAHSGCHYHGVVLHTHVVARRYLTADYRSFLSVNLHLAYSSARDLSFVIRRPFLSSTKTALLRSPLFAPASSLRCGGLLRRPLHPVSVQARRGLFLKPELTVYLNKSPFASAKISPSGGVYSSASQISSSISYFCVSSLYAQN